MQTTTSSLANNTNTEIWTEKYRPKDLNDYYMSKTDLDIIHQWIHDLQTREETKQFLILHGPPGIGKTTLANLILQKYDYEIIECNASDIRSKKQISETLGTISKVSVSQNDEGDFKRTAIIMDEIDGIVGYESGGLQELIDIVLDTTSRKNLKDLKAICPVICTSNNIKEKKLQTLLRLSIVLTVKKPSLDNINKLIDKIIEIEKFTLPNAERLEIVKYANFDYRQLILSLYWYYTKNKYAMAAATTVATSKTVKMKYKDKTPATKTIQQAMINYEDDINLHRLVREICHYCDTPLLTLNYFLTNEVNMNIIKYFTSSDVITYFMNLYINIINILNTIQSKKSHRTKAELVEFYTHLYEIYDNVHKGDLFNNLIFVDKYWDLLDYYETIGIVFPIMKLLQINTSIPQSIALIKNTNTNDKANTNIKASEKVVVSNFNLLHHSQYNYMRQEQITYKKKLGVDYMKTFDMDVINIYYNLKRFQLSNDYILKDLNINLTKKKKNIEVDEQMYYLDRNYSKIMEKIDFLLN